jgi:hypothetical protein
VILLLKPLPQGLDGEAIVVRHLIEREIKKRLAIRIRRQQAPGISMRALAAEFRTSLRVVCDAMTRTALEWRELLDKVMHRKIIDENPRQIVPSRYSSPVALKASVVVDPDLDTTIDFDPDPAAFVD